MDALHALATLWPRSGELSLSAQLVGDAFEVGQLGWFLGTSM